MLLLLIGCIQALPPATILVAGDAGPLARTRVDGAPVAVGWPTAVDPEAELVVGGAILDEVPDGVVRYVAWEGGAVVDDLVVGTDADPDAVDLYAEPDAAWAVADLVGGDVEEGATLHRLRAFDVWAKLAEVAVDDLPDAAVEVFPVLLGPDGGALDGGVSSATAAWSGAAAGPPGLLRAARGAPISAAEARAAAEAGAGAGGAVGEDELADDLGARLAAEQRGSAYDAVVEQRLAWAGLYRADDGDCRLLDLTGGWRACDDLLHAAGTWEADDDGLRLDGEPVASSLAPLSFHLGHVFVRAGSPR